MQACGTCGKHPLAIYQDSRNDASLVRLSNEEKGAFPLQSMQAGPLESFPFTNVAFKEARILCASN